MQSSVKREYIEYLIKFIEIGELEKEYRIYLHIVLFWGHIVLEYGLGQDHTVKAYPLNPRLRNQNFTILKIALNRVLTLAACRSRRPLSESVFRSQKAPLGVELWSFYCKKRISVPMSYITFLHSSICLQNVCFPHKLINYWPRMYAFRIS